ncbi:MAG: hypothetical protein ACRDDA_04730 [Aeromonas sp.]
MMNAMREQWYTKGFSTQAEKFCDKCITCITNIVGKQRKMVQSAHPQPEQPFDHLMMDYIELTPSEGKKYCLVMVDMEAMPTRKADAEGVCKMLLKEAAILLTKLSRNSASILVLI